MTRLFVPMLLGVALFCCTKTNPNAQIDGLQLDDGPHRLDGPTPGTLGGPCLPGDRCNAGLICRNGICVPAVDGGKWDLGNRDGPRPEGGPPLDGPKPPDQTPTCTPVGYKQPLLLDDTSGDWRVAAEPQTQYKSLTITAAKPMQAAAMLDYNAGGEQVAGFVVSRPSQYNTPVQEATGAVQDMAQNLSGVLTVRSQGTQGKTHDGFDAVVGLTLDLKLLQNSNIALVRRPTVAGLLQVPLSSLGGIPPAFGNASNTFVIRLAAVMRKNKRVVFVGAVTTESSDADFSKLTRALASDLASANLLAQEGATLGNLCDIQKITTKPKNQVDIIWVMDESGSMDSKRAAIAASAASFFTQLQQTGLDFRMGVTNVCDPIGSSKAAVGKFCSKSSANQSDMGGVDRFLLPTEQSLFSACINNPPGYEPAQEYGLVNAQEAVKKHLPRAPNDQSKIRTDAQVVIIVVTDEGPQSLKNVIGSNPFSQCTLGPSDQNKTNNHIKPYVDYLKGTTDPGAKVDYFQVIGGICGSSGCLFQPDVSHGYIEVAGQLKGQIYDVCQSNLATAVSTIIGGIVATASAFYLQQVPVASTLSVSLDAAMLARSNVNGFRHEAGTKELQFLGTAQIKLGSTVIASYRLW